MGATGLDGPMPPEPSAIDRLAELARASRSGYHELFRFPSMSTGVYLLARGGTDRQRPHSEDEVYFVLRGRGRFLQGTRDRAVEAGDALFVPAKVEHRFHAIEEELLLFVVFAPAESP